MRPAMAAVPAASGSFGFMTRPSEVASASSTAALRLRELVGAFTSALDLTEAQPEGHSLRVAVIGMTVARPDGRELLAAGRRQDGYGGS